MPLLAIETTCDETAAAVVTREREVLSSIVASQEQLHARWRGVVPEVASRAHVERIIPVIDEAVARAGIDRRAIEAVAVAVRPGLVGSLLVGLAAGKAIAAGLLPGCCWAGCWRRPTRWPACWRRAASV
jgi:N6-L-threonylcarbamoyladenine synthase